MNVEQPLTGFQTRLEMELVKVVTERGAAPRGRTRPVAWRRPAIGIGGLAAVAIAVPLVLDGTGSPAYAVANNPDGSLTVTINDYKNPQGLERRLAATGVPVKVVVGKAGPGCRRLSTTPWPTQEQVRAIFRGDAIAGHSFVFVPAKVPAGATVLVQIIRPANGNQFLIFTGAAQTSVGLHWVGCGPDGPGGARTGG